LAPRPGVAPLSYHSRPERWVRDGEDILLQTVARGQEFVLDCEEYPGIYGWFAKLFAEVSAAV
jgi:hypothetical protein